MKFVASSARDDVHRAYRGHARLQIEVEAGNLELLNRLYGKVLPRPAVHRLDDVSAVYRQSRQCGIATTDRDVEDIVRVARGARRNAHAGFERSQLKEIPSIQRQAVDLLARDDAVNFEIGRVDERRRIAGDDHSLGSIADFEPDFD